MACPGGRSQGYADRAGGTWRPCVHVCVVTVADGGGRLTALSPADQHYYHLVWMPEEEGSVTGDAAPPPIATSHADQGIRTQSSCHVTPRRPTTQPPIPTTRGH